VIAYDPRPMRARLVVSLLVAAALLVSAACGGDDDDAAESAGTTAAGAATGAAEVQCESVEAPEPRPEGTLTAPTEPLGPGDHSAVVTTNCGTFTIALDAAASPNTVASFVALAEDGFFDETVFHRIVPGFVIQGGDPTATGTGGPGYQTVDTPAPSTQYPFGTVAMAKGAAEAPGTSGSQFFVVTAPDAQLPPEYAVIGRVTEGSDVVMTIGMLGDPATEQPTQPVVVESIEIEKA
jgi:cyclophilin family peptidyl-prolyl cis-trans isomerase